MEKSTIFKKTWNGIKNSYLFLKKHVKNLSKFTWNIIFKFLEFYAKYFTIPLFMLLALSLVPLCENINNTLKITCKYISITILVLWIVSAIFTKKYKFKQGRLLFISFSLAFFLSLFLSSIHYISESEAYYVIGIIVFELYAISYIVFNTINHSTPMINTILMCFQLVFFGYIAILIATYNNDFLKDKNTMFNSLTTLFSAIVGGSLTLGGVAWTIKNQREQNKIDEETKYKPYLILTKKRSENIAEGYLGLFAENKKIKNPYYYFIPQFNIINSSNAECILKGIVVDNTRSEIDNLFMLRNTDACLNVCLTSVDIFSDTPVKSVYLVSESVLGKEYFYKCKFHIEDRNDRRENKLTHLIVIDHIGIPMDKIS